MTDYKSFAVDLAQQAGKIIRNTFLLDIKTELKKDNTFITASDTFINHMAIEAIQDKFPSHSITGEEESKEQESEYVWLCDPIDGTTPFAHGIPVATFSLALLHSGNPILGVVYDPFMDRMFVAEKGKGAYLNNKKITVSADKTLTHTLVYFQIRKHDDENKLNSAGILKELVQNNIKVVDFHSSAYAGVLVAAGSLSGVVFPRSKPWDVAAAKIIIDEAGGKCTDFHGNNQRYGKDINGFIGSNGLVHDEILAFIEKYSH